MDEIFRLIQGSEKLPEDEPSEGPPCDQNNTKSLDTELMMLSKQDIRYLYQFIAKKNWRVLRSWFEDLKRIRGIIGRCRDQFRPLSEFSIARNCITNNHTIYEHALAGNEKETFDDSEGHDWYMDDVWVPAPVTCGITAASAISPEATAGWPTSYPYSLSATEMAEMARQITQSQQQDNEVLARMAAFRQQYEDDLNSEAYAVSETPRYFQLIRTNFTINPNIFFRNIGQHLIFIAQQMHEDVFDSSCITLVPNGTYSLPDAHWMGFKLQCNPGGHSIIGIKVRNATLGLHPFNLTQDER